MTPGLGVEPGPHWWEASALTTAPSLLPRGKFPVFLANLNATFTFFFPFFYSYVLEAWDQRNPELQPFK